MGHFWIMPLKNKIPLSPDCIAVWSEEECDDSFFFQPTSTKHCFVFLVHTLQFRQMGSTKNFFTIKVVLILTFGVYSMPRFSWKLLTLRPLRSISFDANEVRPSLKLSFWLHLPPYALPSRSILIEVPYCRECKGKKWGINDRPNQSFTVKTVGKITDVNKQ